METNKLLQQIQNVDLEDFIPTAQSPTPEPSYPSDASKEDRRRPVASERKSNALTKAGKTDRPVRLFHITLHGDAYFALRDERERLYREKGETVSLTQMAEEAVRFWLSRKE